FAMACATAFAGINEKLMLTLSSDYAQLVPLAVVGNVLVLLIAAFALLVGFIVTYPPYQRVEIEDSEKVPLTQTDGGRDFQSTSDDRVLEE
ncbi:hypothetical protein, partial [Salmonella sp. s51944]|uniref:hypothetical protein n=1 Tax=Salmonella sp. s51944 TaxID=3159655 RepID=UPI0039808A73